MQPKPAMFAFTALTLLGCSGATPCTAIAAASLTVDVVDPDGSSLAPSSASWSVDGGAEQEVDCIESDCSTFVAGWEVEGSITVRAVLELPTGADTACVPRVQAEKTVEVSLGPDGCHVVGKQVDLVLDPSQATCR